MPFIHQPISLKNLAEKKYLPTTKSFKKYSGIKCGFESRVTYFYSAPRFSKSEKSPIGSRDKRTRMNVGRNNHSYWEQRFLPCKVFQGTSPLSFQKFFIFGFLFHFGLYIYIYIIQTICYKSQIKLSQIFGTIFHIENKDIFQTFYYQIQNIIDLLDFFSHRR